MAPNGFTVVTKKKPKKPEPFDLSNVENYEETFDKECRESKKIVNTITTFLTTICRDFTDKVIEAASNDHKVVYLFDYNEDPERGEVYNDRIGDYSTSYILKEEWRPLIERYLPGYKLSIKNNILKYINNSKFNNGKDPITNKEYKVSIMFYKRKESAFKNGILVSRNGIQYS